MNMEKAHAEINSAWAAIERYHELKDMSIEYEKENPIPEGLQEEETIDSLTPIEADLSELKIANQELKIKEDEKMLAIDSLKSLVEQGELKEEEKTKALESLNTLSTESNIKASEKKLALDSLKAITEKESLATEESKIAMKSLEALTEKEAIRSETKKSLLDSIKNLTEKGQTKREEQTSILSLLKKNSDDSARKMAEREKFLEGWFEKLAPTKEKESQGSKKEETSAEKLKSLFLEPFSISKKKERDKEETSTLSLADAIKSLLGKNDKEPERNSVPMNRTFAENPLLTELVKSPLKERDNLRTSSVLGSADATLWTKEQISPELVLKESLVLSPIKLRDITAEIVGNQEKINKKTESQGDNYYDIDINVERLDNDYDVEQMAEKIKRIIQDDASFRNVQSVRFAR